MRRLEETPEALQERLLARRLIAANGCWLFTGCRRGGYGRIAFHRRTHQAHRVSAWAFLGIDISDPARKILHECDNPPCFNPDHLRPGTQVQNIYDAVAKGRHARGDSSGGRRHPQSYAKLTDAQAAEIRERYAAGAVSQASLASEYGVVQATVWRVVSRRSYGWVAA